MTIEKPSNNLLKLFLGESADDEGNAQSVRAAVGDRFLYCEAYGWMTWTGTHWSTDEAEAALDRAIVATLKQRRTAAVDADKEAVVRCSIPSTKRVRDAKALFRSIVGASVATFDAAPDALNVKNGVLNLRTGELAEHNPVQRFTYAVPIEYDPKADQGDWRAFLAEAVGQVPDLLNYLQRAVGYSLTGHTSEECLWYIYGPPRSGKGAFTETLLALLPHPLGVEVDFATFTAKREGDTQNFDLAPLRPARLIIASESNSYSALNTAKIKQLTGGNYVWCSFKHRSHFSYRPQYKTWLVSNEPLNADVDDDATWYRAKVVEFPNGHEGSEDKGMKARMRRPEALRGVLAWAVEGAMAWFKSPNGLQHPEKVRKYTQEHRDARDMVQAWIDECCDEKPGDWTAYDKLYPAYLYWCKENGVKPKELRGLTRSLKAKGYPVGEPRTIGGKTYKGVMNLEPKAV